MTTNTRAVAGRGEQIPSHGGLSLDGDADRGNVFAVTFALVRTGARVCEFAGQGSGGTRYATIRNVWKIAGH
jgi:hypothetical protein